LFFGLNLLYHRRHYRVVVRFKIFSSYGEFYGFFEALIEQEQDEKTKIVRIRVKYFK
jgi:capsule polysaccharide export protein KpsE/RkpR